MKMQSKPTKISNVSSGLQNSPVELPETQTISSSVTFNYLLNKALRILAQRDHSEQELRRKLSMRVHTGEQVIGDDNLQSARDDIDRVIVWCYENRLLDDMRFIQRLIESYCRKGYGPQRIFQDSKQKGIDKDVVNTALMESEIDWSSVARNVAERKFGIPVPEQWQLKAKVVRFLLYRGFFMEDIENIYRNFAD